MNEKIDLRVLKTKEAIKNAFKNMIIEMPYEKITIKELCERALINRKTFYLHYSSIDDLLEEFQEEIAEEYFDRIKNFDHIKEVDKIIPIIDTMVLFLFIFKCLIVNLFKIFILLYLLIRYDFSIINGNNTICI